MTESELLTAGYRKCSGPGPWSNADCFYQRCVRDDHGNAKLYYVNVAMWDHTKYSRDARVGWEAQGHFYRGNDRNFRLEVPIEAADLIQEIETVFAEFYQKMECVPDIHNQD